MSIVDLVFNKIEDIFIDKSILVPKDFDWKFYLNNYPDLKANGITNENKAKQHWLRYGVDEKRIYKEVRSSNKQAPKSLVLPFDPSRWKLNSKESFTSEIVGNTYTLNKKEHKHEYIWIDGDSFASNFPTKNLNELKIPASTCFRCTIDGLKKTENLSISVWTFIFDDTKLIESKEHKLSTTGNVEPTFEFTTPSSTRYYRLAIRFEGIGTCSINNLFFTEIKSEKLFKPFVPLKKLPTSSVKVACIMDTFTYECFRYEAELLPLSKKNWLNEISKFKPDFLFVESAWQGNNGQWASIIVNYNKKNTNIDGTELKNLLAYCKKEKIKTVFWNKEDSPNYDVFIHAAKDFEYIFTTDENCISKYKSDVGHNNIFVLPFAAQPVIHNPINSHYLRKYDVCFAGSWYGEKHGDRSEQMMALLDGASEYDFKIFDRMHNAPNLNSNRIFPPKFSKYINGGLSYDEMLSAYRGFKVFLNVNSVTDSLNMFSRRVFELYACKTAVVSTPSIGINHFFKDIIPIVKTKNETKSALKHLLTHDEFLNINTQLGYRLVHKNHTYKNRFNTILETINCKTIVSADSVTVITCTNREEFLDKCKTNFVSQIHNDKKLIVVINSSKFNIDNVYKLFEDVPNVSILQFDESHSLGYCLNQAISRANSEYIAKMDDDDFYGPNYLSDQLIPFSFGDISVVGKWTVFYYLEGENKMLLRFPGYENKLNDWVTGSSLVVKRSVFETIKFKESNRGEDSQFLKDCKEKGYKIYATDKYNYMVLRRQDLSTHTWQIEPDAIHKSSVPVCKGLNLDKVFI